MKIFIMIPTYNEAANIRKLLPMILKTVEVDQILVVDDNSPDGTAGEVRKLAKRFPGKISLLLRQGIRGRGTAGIAGFKDALKKGAEVVVEMDADFSHHPKHLPQMLEEIKRHDVVVGSRFTPGGEDRRGFWRHLITTLGNFYIRMVLGLRLKDSLSGFRVFKRKVLAEINLDGLLSSDWAVVQEILYRADLLGFDIKELPIVFVDRRHSRSKVNLRVLARGILMVLVLKVVFSSFWRGGRASK